MKNKLRPVPTHRCDHDPYNKCTFAARVDYDGDGTMDLVRMVDGRRTSALIVEFAGRPRRPPMTIASFRGRWTGSCYIAPDLTDRTAVAFTCPEASAAIFKMRDGGPVDRRLSAIAITQEQKNMSRDPDQQILATAGGLGLGLFAAAFVLIPAFFPAYLLYRGAVVTGANQLHPAILIVLAAATAWILWRLGGVLIRAVPPIIARLAIGAYIGACYTFVFFPRELTTARAELDVTWLIFSFAIFKFIGWKIGGALVLKAHRDRLIRAQRKADSAPTPL